MAITGTGTQEDPYLVHSYSELKTVTTDNSYCPQYSHRYIALDADINCNDYGVEFEWETIALGHDSRGFTFDLNEHTIKNVMVKLNNCLFDASYNGSNVYGAWYADFIGNGKLLNVFSLTNSTAYLIKGRGAANATISNLSMSVNVGQDSRGVFRDTKLNAVSCYIESGSFTVTTDVNALILSFSSGGDQNSDARIKNCDFYINISNLKAPLYSAYNQSERLVAIDSRFRGKASNSSNTSIEFMACGYISNCVMNIDFSGFHTSNGKISRYNCSGVINTDITPLTISRSNMTQVTSSEIINGDALRAKGFTVVNVVGG